MQKVIGKRNKNIEISTGSPAKGEPFFLAVGIIRKPHGILGEVFVEVFDNNSSQINPGKSIYIGESHENHLIKTIRQKDKGLLLSLKDITDRESVEKFRGSRVYLESKNIPNLEPNEYYFHQVIGLTAVTENGETVGKIKEIIQTGANDVYIIERSGKEQNELLVPAIISVVRKIDLEKRQVVLRLPKWG